ncbi:hypothetical protein, partial [Chryseobacterium kwangjuense]|uniref:hypothetical protein n=1 Tax=Chryseobacterium kwangjuense TaxID=267125 RepID=UPI001EE6B42D
QNISEENFKVFLVTLNPYHTLSLATPALPFNRTAKIQTFLTPATFISKNFKSFLLHIFC